MRTYSLLLFCLFFLAATAVQAQEITFGGLDQSPMDAAHYPVRSAYKNYLDEDDADRSRKIKVLYSRPQKKDRNVFGSLEPYGQDWRLGANEATEVTFFQAVEINNTTLPAGSYTMFAQLYPNQWIVKISGERFIGGAANRDISKDLVTVSIPTERVSQTRESFVIGFRKIDENNVHMIFEWDKTRAALPISFNPPILLPEDASPMDLIQFPDRSRLRNFVEEKDLAANEPQVRVVYSRPQLKGRKVFGEMLEFGTLWRLGANETTEVTFFKEVTVGDEKIRPGRYGLFAEINAEEWEFVLHRDVQSWGSANYDPETEIVRVKAKTEKTPTTLEALSMTFVDRGDGKVELVVGWEDTMARLPILVNPAR